MKVLVISANTEQINMPVLPVGLASVAAVAEHAGHEVQLLNLMFKEGRIARSDNLLFPRFYLARNLDGWLQETVREWIGKRPNRHM